MESYRGTIEDKLDAIYLIEAVRQDRIPEIRDRISKHQRCRYIKPGNIFVWSEKNAKIKRWTDGKKWSASRVSGMFLTYYEMIPRKQQICNHKECGMAPVDIKTNGLVKRCFKCCVEDETFHVVSYTDIKVSHSHQVRPSKDVRFKDLSVDHNYVLQTGREESSSTKAIRTSRTKSLPSLTLPSPQRLESGTGPEQRRILQRRNSV